MPTLQVQTNVPLTGDAADRFFAAATEVVATGASAAAAAHAPAHRFAFSPSPLRRVPHAWRGGGA